MLIEVGSVIIDVGRREIRSRSIGSPEVEDGLAGAEQDQTIPLTAREFDLLVYLATNLGLALSRRQLLNGVWGDGWYGDERTVDVHIRQLRKKIGSDLPLATVWGVGYRLG
jgi:DNA-binding response OmpR family regulator